MDVSLLRAKMGWNARPTRQVILQDAIVPVANRRGVEDIGFNLAMSGLDGGRVNIGAASLGGAQAALYKTLAYLREPFCVWQADRAISGPAVPHRRHGDTAALMLKDLTLSQEAAASAGATTPLGAHVADIYRRFVETGSVNVDFSGVINAIRKGSA